MQLRGIVHFRTSESFMREVLHSLLKSEFPRYFSVNSKLFLTMR